MGQYVSIPGGSNQSVQIHGNGTVVAGNGNDSISIGGNGAITVGAGNDHITMHGSGTILQKGVGGHDTINLGHGHDTITEAGTATVYSAYGSATIHGGTFEFVRHDPTATGHDQHANMLALTGNATFVGGAHCDAFIGGSGNVIMRGGTANDTFVGGSGHATMTGGSGHNMFEFTTHGVGGTNVITNFVSGHDKLYLEGQSLSYLQSHGDVSVSHGNTYISLDGGKTTVELKGFTNLSSHDVTTHK